MENNLDTGYTDYVSLTEIINKYFNIIDSYIEEDRYVFQIDYSPGELKHKFKGLNQELKTAGNYIPVLDDRDGQTCLYIIPSFIHEKKDNKLIPTILFFLTLLTVYVDGYLRSYSPVYFDIVNNYNPLTMTILFTVSLLGIIGIHELGHKFALALHDIKASWPNFIPGIPGIFPTFGAVISEREPPVNRDTLFDIGFAGPIAGFVANIVVSVYAAYTAPVITIKELQALEAKYGASTPFPVPIMYIIIQNIVRPVGPNQIIIVSPIVWASVVGFIITGLNLLPAWQLDGGHLARATVGRKYHGLLTIVSIILLFLTGYWVMALIVLFFYFASRGQSARPLDDASPLSRGRKILFIFSLILAVLCLPNILITPL
jgi:Zn-dependent protease